MMKTNGWKDIEIITAPRFERGNGPKDTFFMLARDLPTSVALSRLKTFTRVVTCNAPVIHTNSEDSGNANQTDREKGGEIRASS